MPPEAQSQFFEVPSPTQPASLLNFRVTPQVGLQHANQALVGVLDLGIAPKAVAVPALPLPLEVCVLDRKLEREQRTTAVLVRQFGFRDSKLGYDIIVPEGFETDFASIPTLLQAVISPFGRHAKAAVLHDWLYSVGEPKRKSFADSVLLHAMEELDVLWWKQKIMYWAVRLFGGRAYRHAEREWKFSFARVMPQQRVPPPLSRPDFFEGQKFGISRIPSDGMFPNPDSPWPAGTSPVTLP